MDSFQMKDKYLATFILLFLISIYSFFGYIKLDTRFIESIILIVLGIVGTLFKQDRSPNTSNTNIENAEKLLIEDKSKEGDNK